MGKSKNKKSNKIEKSNLSLQHLPEQRSEEETVVTQIPVQKIIISACMIMAML